ncbi:translation initiation factor eIF2B subunit gamma KNAG_0G02730 [Huiozyma naganishii CBS 8797]|uniref:Translation initiation factor eIF2B subunit gamma n=1 Tax=Huiozyma naganishii (strain ATCC MYA-139 / BCRC 22969 / CBS 8797 / KCTC 17520 / NBRC 10181 / NCYC 3082 / Yp74L-3) TaxID=1071383 RepID=J7S837_HUIN7|nr:hypothetical protein KNAG_0G02730 [Kazachstania naganishii CBS 8797]CCK71329.1 hypothetical protein KNAG_0G02730 [Kazachstania naganishii CBS 8797]
MQLQAFIFCGEGERLEPFSVLRGGDAAAAGSSAGDGVDSQQVRLPKALLPIANRPMLEYVIDWCDQGDFSEINVVAPAGELIETIQQRLAEFLKLRQQQFGMIKQGLSLNIHSHYSQEWKQINFIPSEYASLGECLQHDLLPRIVSDFVLLPCDFITDVPPQIMVNQFQNRDDENLAMAVYYKNATDPPPFDKKQVPPTDYTLYSTNEDSNKQPVLLDVYTSNNVHRTKYLQVRSHLLWKYPNTTVSKRLLNASIYFCSVELCTLLMKQGKQRRESNNAHHSEAESVHTEDDDEGEDNNNRNEPGSNNSTAIYPSYFKHNKNTMVPDPISMKSSLEKLFRDLARRSWKHVTPARETVGVFVLSQPDLTTFVRANNLSTYMDANRFILKIKSMTRNLMTSSSAIGADALVDPSCRLGEKTSIKLSALRNAVQVGNKCRISGSVLSEGAVVEDECILDNVILGPYARVGKKSKLTNCYVEGGFIVEEKSMYKGETLVVYGGEDTEDYESTFVGSDTESAHLSSDAIYSSGDSSQGDSDGNEVMAYDEEDEFEDDGLFER